MRYFYNKDNLPPNKERRRSLGNKQPQAFGAYRQLTLWSNTEMLTAAAVIAGEMTEYAGQARPNASAFQPLGRMAVTFVEFGSVRKAMNLGGLKEGLALGRKVQQIETPDMNVPFIDVEWYGSGDRKLVAILDRDSDAFTELRETAEAIESVFQETPGPLPVVRVPDHLTFLRYGHSRDGQPLNLRQKNYFADMAITRLDEKNIKSVTLGGLVIGEGYEREL